MAAENFSSTPRRPLQEPHPLSIFAGFQKDDANEICHTDFTFPTSLTVPAPSRTASRHTLEDSPEAKQEYFTKCVPLYKAALEGDWKSAKKIINKDKTIVRACITKGWHTVLHVAAGAKRVYFVKKLLKLLDEQDLILQDQNGNTAFCFAVAAGTLPVAHMMIRKNPRVPEIRGGKQMTPLYLAALFGHDETASYLYPKLIKLVDEWERVGIFFTCINNDLYELALKMVHGYPELVVARDPNSETALHLLARKPSALAFKSSGIWKCFAYSCTNRGRLKRTPGLQLLKRLWEEIMWQSDRTVTDVIRKPSHVLFMATKLGNLEFVAELIGSYPDLIWETDDCNRSLFHVAVMYHHARIFNLVHKLGLYKDFVLSFKDDKKSNILHLAAQLAPPHQSNMVPKPALQMQRDLLWFKEVKKVVPPLYLETKNSEGKTPRDIFHEQHKGLLENGESGVKSGVHACFYPRCYFSVGFS
ncbi:PREDICTED: ankyrin [Prunus dulcis]|uniref:PREDICTED: ankyrin n=1 Tax=Prunus dulcis TaxID=3755 RepID=A0A5E4GA95_PRUDU|nr:PREDICTED: ankyrin [Prunus dulcis]